MKSKTSFFNFTLVRKNIVRFSPIWITYLVIFIVGLPLIMGVTLSSQPADLHTTPAMDMAYYAGTVLEIVGPIAACIYGLCLAMALCSYLYSARSVGLYHSLPIRRSGLFGSNYLSGLLLIAGPNAIVALLAALVTLAGGGFCPGMLLAWFLGMCAMELFFFSFAVLCAMFTGHLVALPIFYAIFNGLCWGIYWAVIVLIRPMLYGFSSDGSDPALVQWLTPLLNLYGNVRCSWNWENSTMTDVNLSGVPALTIYAAAGVALALLAYAVYRRRRSETAGDIVSVGWAKVVFRYGVAFCAALSIGQVIYFLVFDRSNALGNIYVHFLCMALAAFVGYFVAQMLLNKSFRVLKKSWRGGLLCVALVACLFAGAALDVTGFVHRVPKADRVQSVTVAVSGDQYGRATLYEADSIEKVCAIHQAVLDQHDNGGGSYSITGVVEVDYTMKDGSVLRRSYWVDLSREDLDDPATLTGQLQELVNTPEFLVTYRLEELVGPEELHLTGGLLEYYEAGQYDMLQERSFSAADAETLREALLQDAQAGHLEGIQLIGTDSAAEEKRYTNGLYFDYYIDDPNAWNRIYIALNSDMTYTIAAMEELGILNDHVTLRLDSEQQAYFGALDSGTREEGSATVEVAAESVA